MGLQKGTVPVVRAPHRPGWTRLVLCAERTLWLLLDPQNFYYRRAG
jgi:hypothetical protein